MTGRIISRRRTCCCDYFRRIADKYGLRKHIRFETQVVEAAFDEADRALECARPQTRAAKRRR